MSPVFNVAAASYAARTGAIRWRRYSRIEAGVNNKMLRVVSRSKNLSAADHYTPFEKIALAITWQR